MRLPDWQPRLAAYVEAASERPFSWADADCCRWAAGAVELITGVNPMGTLLLAYSDQAGAEGLIKRGGGLARLVAGAAGSHGWPEIEPRTARSGDLGLVSTPEGPAAAIAFGWTWIVKGRGIGVAQVPLRAALRAWSVA